MRVPRIAHHKPESCSEHGCLPYDSAAAATALGAYMYAAAADIVDVVMSSGAVTLVHLDGSTTTIGVLACIKCENRYLVGVSSHLGEEQWSQRVESN